MTLPEADEARRLTALLGAQPFQLLTYLSQQLGVIKTQAQQLIGLCGITITVTGFSGAHMIKGGAIPSALLVLGIALILASAVICLSTLTNTRWVTQDLSDELVQTAQVVIARRNRLQSQLSRAGRLLALGLGAYLGAVAAAAIIHALPELPHR